MKFLKFVVFSPLTKYWFSPTELPLNEGRNPKAASPSTAPGASKVKLVRSWLTGI